MRLLVLSFYFYPDLSAGSFRITALHKALMQLASAGAAIDVVTTMPNRYNSYLQSAEATERMGNTTINRIALPAHSSDFIGQSKAFARFAKDALRMTSDRQYDVVFATSSRLMTATLGAWIARRNDCPLYLDIRDIFADTIRDLMPRPLSYPIGAAMSMLESWTMNRASHINLVSEGFADYFRSRYPDRPLSFYTNGVDQEFVGPSARVDGPRESGEPFTILYAGNIGEGQCLHEIVPELAHNLGGRARFVIVGDGGRRAQLEAALEEAGVTNVELCPPVPRERLIKEYQRADVLFLHLGHYQAFEKVLPSKLFEYAALGKPILAGIAGYAARFVAEEISNAAVFPPTDAVAAGRALQSLRIESTPRPEFVTKYARDAISKAMAEDVIGFAKVQ